jgi:D-3-phosphoglycerate dehydrogenase
VARLLVSETGAGCFFVLSSPFTTVQGAFFLDRSESNALPGIVGYGHIGSQLSVLAQAMGMNVIYYDVVTLMALGTSRQVPTLEILLEEADFVTLHVPDVPETRGMISTSQLDQMKDGAYLINASRGSVVDIPALVAAMRSGKIAGAALDVYPNEPAANGDYFTNSLNKWAEDLRSVNNIILTPHIGGSTEEAQRAIGIEGKTK